jgi:saccharopine dehydrogenase-like NADP-dependent oxidoreductase
VSVRGRVKAIQKDLRDGALTPDMVRESEIVLTALLGNVNDEVRESDMAFKVVLRDALQTHEKANRARIEAECSDEYRRAREAKDTLALVVEMIRSCRSYSRSLNEELRLAR